jgi:hypothetical protein
MVYFQNKKSRHGQILEGPALEDVGILYGHLIYFTAIWSIFPVLVDFSCFGMLNYEKYGNTALCPNGIRSHDPWLQSPETIPLGQSLNLMAHSLG